jgi:hypothetical protein
MADSTGPATPAAAGDSLATLDTLYFVDIDSSLRAGQGIWLAFEDTIPFAAGTAETVLATAPRVKVSDVVRMIGERMEENRARMAEHSFTGLTKVVAYFKPQADKPRKQHTYEQAERIRFDGSGEFQQVMLWQRERKYEDDELVDEEVKDEVDVSWNDLSDAVVEAVPFSLSSGNEYKYQILDRDLVGMNVIYTISFQPKSQFKTLPSGVVWVDYSDMAIRRVEAEMTQAVPMPLIIESIPVYKFRIAQKGEFRVMSDLYAEIRLRSVPLLKLPETVEIYYQASRHRINGVDYPDEEGPQQGQGERP